MDGDAGICLTKTMRATVHNHTQLHFVTLRMGIERFAIPGLFLLFKPTEGSHDEIHGCYVTVGTQRRALALKTLVPLIEGIHLLLKSFIRTLIYLVIGLQTFNLAFTLF